MPKIKHIARSAQDSGPDGVMVDMSGTGWVGASSFRPQ
jgi:hypothetical protein